MPSFFRCSLCGDYMSDPVIVCTKNPPAPLIEGISYERSALESWVASNNHTVQFVPNVMLKKLIDGWRAANQSDDILLKDTE